MPIDLDRVLVEVGPLTVRSRFLIKYSAASSPPQREAQPGNLNTLRIRRHVSPSAAFDTDSGQNKFSRTLFGGVKPDFRTEDTPDTRFSPPPSPDFSQRERERESEGEKEREMVGHERVLLRNTDV